MNPSDFIQRFLIEQANVRGELVRLDQTLGQILQRNSYPPLVAQLLAEATGASVLLSSTLKFDGRLVIQARGHGPMPLLVAECSHHRQVRAIAHWESNVPDEGTLRQCMGDARLAITIEPEGGQRYQGIVPLEEDHLDACLGAYFERSEQLATHIRLVTRGQQMAGLLLQRLPGASDEDDWNRLSLLAATLTPAELLDLAPETMIHRLYSEDDVRLFEPEPVSFHCTCSAERTRRALNALGEADVYELLAEMGHIIIDCQFCGHQYVYDRQQVDQAFGKHSLH